MTAKDFTIELQCHNPISIQCKIVRCKYIDVEPNFNHHIALLCNKAGRQINALSRLSNVVNVDTKILI